MDDRTESVSGNPETDWLQTARDSGHTAYVPTTEGVAPKVRWTFGPFSFVSTPIIVGKSLYVTARVPKTGLFGQRTHDDKAVLYRISASEGKAEQVTATKNTWSRWGANDPVFYRGTIYLASNGELFALNARTGNVEWRRETAGANFAPVAADGLIVAGGSDAVYAFDAGSGKRLWRNRIPRGQAVLYPPAVTDSRVVYVENDGNSRENPQLATLKAVRADTGEGLWSKEDDVVSYGMPVVDDGTVYLGNRKYVYALDVATGKRRWRASIARPDFTLGPKLCAGPDHIYVPENLNDRGRLAALSRKNGERQWTLETEGGLGHRPVRTGENLYVCVDGKRNRAVGEDFHASALSLDPSTGERYWRYRLFSYSADAPVAAGNSLYVTYDSGPDEVSLAAFGY